MAVGVVIFFTVLIVLSFNVRSTGEIIVPRSHIMKFPNGSRLYRQNVSEINTDNNISNNNSELHHHTPQYWTVVCTAIHIQETLDSISDIVAVLPMGSILIGSTVISLPNGEAASVIRLKVIFPVNGYVAIQNTSQSSTMGSEGIHVKLINITSTIEPVRHSFIENSVEESASQKDNYCTNTSNFHYNADYRGGDLTSIQNPHDTLTVTDCCLLCQSIPQCFKFTFTNTAKQCWLKHNGAVLVNTKVESVVQPAAVLELRGKKVEPGHGELVFELISGSVHRSDADSASSNVDSANSMNAFDSSIFSSTFCCAAAYADTTVTATSQPNSLFIEQTTHHTNNVHTKNERKITNINQINSQYITTLHNMIHNKQYTTTNNAYQLSTTVHTTHNGWTESHLLGNGLFGTLVTSTLYHEILPLSVSGFYVKKVQQNDNMKQQLARNVNKKQQQQTQKNDVLLTAGKSNAFQQARMEFLKGNYIPAEDLISSQIKSNLGMFQYLYDNVYVLSPQPFIVKQSIVSHSKVEKNNNLRSVIYQLNAETIQSNANYNFGLGRNKLINKLHSYFNYTQLYSTPDSGNVHHNAANSNSNSNSAFNPINNNQQQQQQNIIANKNIPKTLLKALQPGGNQLLVNPQQQLEIANKHTEKRAKFGKIVYIHSTMDWKSGISSTVFVEQRERVEKGKRLVLSFVVLCLNVFTHCVVK